MLCWIKFQSEGDKNYKKQGFESKEKEMIEKYHEQINYISEEYGCDEYVSLLTFLSKNSPIFYKWEMNC